MNVNDLQVGDWVIRKGVPEEHLQIVNQNLNGETVNLDLNGLGITDFASNLEPIPLTYEILELNFGSSEHTFNLDPRYLVYPVGGECMISAQLRPAPDCKKKLSVYNYNNRRGITYECSNPEDIVVPFYVHDLQHMLKQCEINEEVIL